MKLDLHNFESLEKELEDLSPMHRLAFVGACCERLLPNYNAFDFGGLHDYEAQEAAIAVCVTLEACLDPSSQQIMRVAQCVTNTFDAFVPEIDKSFDENWDIEKQAATISNHPFAIREMTKQTEDLQRLKEPPILDKSFLTWLRTSFDNQGRSIIDWG
jgi:uncharacterized protein